MIVNEHPPDFGLPASITYNLIEMQTQSELFKLLNHDHHYPRVAETMAGHPRECFPL